jgi:hypothetical protein
MRDRIEGKSCQCGLSHNPGQHSKCRQAWLNFPYLLGLVTFVQQSPLQLAILDNEIAEGNCKQNNEVPIEMSDSEKTQYSNNQRTYRERNVLLMKHRGQAFSLILDECTQLLQDRMKQDANWNAASTSYDPLDLY